MRRRRFAVRHPGSDEPLAIPATCHIGGETAMPPGASPKRERQYEHIKDSAEQRGESPKRAAEIAARTVNKERAQGRRVAHREQDVDKGHLVQSARRPAIAFRRSGPDEGPALRRGTQAQHQGSLDDDQSPAGECTQPLVSPGMDSRREDRTYATRARRPAHRVPGRQRGDGAGRVHHTVAGRH